VLNHWPTHTYTGIVGVCLCVLAEPYCFSLPPKGCVWEAEKRGPYSTNSANADWEGGGCSGYPNKHGFLEFTCMICLKHNNIERHVLRNTQLTCLQFWTDLWWLEWVVNWSPKRFSSWDHGQANKSSSQTFNWNLPLVKKKFKKNKICSKELKNCFCRCRPYHDTRLVKL